MKFLIFLLLPLIAFGQSTSKPLSVNQNTGVIVAPVSADTFESANAIPKRTAVNTWPESQTFSNASSIKLGVANSVAGSITFYHEDSGFFMQMLTGNLTANRTLFFPDENGVFISTGAVGKVTDTMMAGLVKPAVAVVAVANLTLSGEQTIDGQLTSGSLVLATAQSTGSQNGPWVSAAGAWARPGWYTNGSTTQAPQFLTTLVRLGTTYQGSTWRMTTAAVTIGTTSSAWVQTPTNLNNTVGTVATARLSADMQQHSITFNISSGEVLTAGTKAYGMVENAGTITGWTAICSPSGSVAVDIYKSAYSATTLPSTSIVAAAAPSITANIANKSTSVGTWTTTLTKYDLIGFAITGTPSSATTLTVTLEITPN